MTMFRTRLQLRVVWAYWWLKGEPRSYREMLEAMDFYGLTWEDCRPEWWPPKWWGEVKVTPQ